MRDDYILAAKAVIPDPYILVNVVSRRVKQLRAGSRPLVQSLERLRNDDIALREIAEGKISYELWQPQESDAPAPRPLRSRGHLPTAERAFEPAALPSHAA